MRHSEEELLRIITADFERNHAGRDYDLSRAIDNYRAWEKAEPGNFTIHAPETAFVCRWDSPDTVEFHSINGGTGRDLTDGVTELCLELRRLEAHKAVTYYDTPKVNQLLKFVKFPSYCERVDGGVDRTFKATFTLRNDLWDF